MGNKPSFRKPNAEVLQFSGKAHPEDQPTGTTLANPYMFAMVAREHMQKYHSTKEHFAMIGIKNHAHSVNNPYSQFKNVYSLDQIMSSPVAHDPLSRLQCSPTSDGAAAAIVVSERFAKEYGVIGRCVEILGSEMCTDGPESIDGTSAINAVGYSMTKKCARQLFDKTKLTPEDVQVIELHDCFSSNELSECSDSFLKTDFN